MSFKFLNNHRENKYECHVIPANFNLTPDGPIRATSYVTVADTINMMRWCYGEPNEDDPERLDLSPNWGTRFPHLIDRWFHRNKIQDHHRAELGIREEFHDPEAGFGRRDIEHDDNDAGEGYEEEEENTEE